MGSNPRVCFWNYCDGDCVFQTQSLIASLRQHGVENDFIMISNRERITGATINFQTVIPRPWQPFCLFKIALLDLIGYLDYDYFIWLDSDSYCIAPITVDLTQLCRYSPIHIFLETDLTQFPDHHWWLFNNMQLNQNARRHGARQPLHNCNGGFWMIERGFIRPFMRIAERFWEVSHANGMTFFDEVVFSYATSLVSSRIESHYLCNTRNLWTPNGEEFLCLPDATEQWRFKNWVTGIEIDVKPSIIHLMSKTGKQLLTTAGKCE